MSRTHARIRRTMLTSAIGVAMFAGAPRVEAAWTLTLVNRTGETLTFYDVNESPPPSRVSAGTVPDGGTFSIDPEGYNPVFAWTAGISTAGTAPNGFLIAFALTDSPPLVQYKLFHYKTIPGQAGKDPDLQPILLDQDVVEVAEGDIAIIVDDAWNATIGPLPAGACCTLTICSEVASSGACTDGTFLNGVWCTPELCTSASTTIGTEGGTIETPGGAVSVEFPPDCLSTSQTITISEGDYPSTLYDIMLTGQPGVDFSVHMAYTFEPDTLTFCPEAQVCMSFDRAALGIDAADCSELRFLHKDKICGMDPNSNCQTDADCPPGVSCNLGYHTDPATCTCPAAPTTGKCCASINHFSDFIMATQLEDQPCRGLWCCCGADIVPPLSLMFVALGLVKVRGTGLGRHRRHAG